MASRPRTRGKRPRGRPGAIGGAGPSLPLPVISGVTFANTTAGSASALTVAATETTSVQIVIAGMTTISGAPNEAIAYTNPAAGSRAFTVFATGPGGTTEYSGTLATAAAAAPPVISEFAFNKTTYAIGDVATISWTLGGGAAATITPQVTQGGTPVTLGGSGSSRTFMVTALGGFAATLNVSGPGGTASASATATAIEAPADFVEPAPTIVDDFSAATANFNGVAADAGGTWATNGLGVVSAGYVRSTTNIARYALIGTGLAADEWCALDGALSNATSYPSLGLHLRATADTMTSGVRAVLLRLTSTWKIYDGATEVASLDLPEPLVAGSLGRIYFEVAGTTATLRVDGEVILTATVSANVAPGKVGFSITGVTGTETFTVDNFAGGSLAAVAAPTVAPSFAAATTATANEIGVTLSSNPPAGASLYAKVAGGVAFLVTGAPEAGAAYTLTTGVVGGTAQTIVLLWQTAGGAGPASAPQTVTSAALPAAFTAAMISLTALAGGGGYTANISSLPAVNDGTLLSIERRGKLSSAGAYVGDVVHDNSAPFTGSTVVPRAAGTYDLQFRVVTSAGAGAWGPTPALTVAVTAAAGGGSWLVEQVKVRGQAATIAPPTGTSGPYSATGLPLGMTLNTGTGVISGTPLQYTPYRTLTLNHSTGSVVSSVGISLRDGVPPPRYHVPNFDPDAVEALGLWDTQNNFDTVSAMAVGIANAQANVGTYTAPRFHKLTHNGPVETWPTVAIGTDTGPTEAFNENKNSYIYVTFPVRKKVDSWDDKNRPGMNAMLLLDNLEVGTFKRGGTSRPKSIGWRRGRFGKYFMAEYALKTHTEDRLPADVSMSFEACWFAGYFNLFQSYGSRVAMLDCMVTHLCNDGFTSIGGNGGANALFYMYLVDLTAYRQRSRTVQHSDLIQISNANNNGQPGKKIHLDVYGCVGELGEIANGNVGIRAAKHNSFSEMSFNLKDYLFATGGIEGLTLNFSDIHIDGVICAPLTGEGSTENVRWRELPSWDTAPGTASAKDVWTSQYDGIDAWLGKEPAVQGNKVIWDQGSNLTTVFPDIDGAVIGTKFIPTFKQVALHPAAIRAYVERWKPAMGWVASGVMKPGDMGCLASLWGAVPALVVPTIAVSSPSVVVAAARQMTINASSGGLMTWMVTANDDKPSEGRLLAHTKGGPNYLSMDANQNWPNALGMARVEAGTSTIDLVASGYNSAYATMTAGVQYYLWTILEHPSGGLSTVQRTPFIAA